VSYRILHCGPCEIAPDPCTRTEPADYTIRPQGLVYVTPKCGAPHLDGSVCDWNVRVESYEQFDDPPQEDG
jgi:hypothetical protein